jgi:enamine deaminase RidA (YjgF/YER057c/UK114 family)
MEDQTMKKDSIPFGRAMKMKVAFCTGIGIDTSEMKRLIWISGQLSFDEQDTFVGKGDIRVQTEQVLTNIQKALNKLGGTMDDIVQVTVFVKEMENLKDIHDVRLKYFSEPYPTSTLVAVTGFVHPDALIEINAMAAV